MDCMLGQQQLLTDTATDMLQSIISVLPLLSPNIVCSSFRLFILWPIKLMSLFKLQIPPLPQIILLMQNREFVSTCNGVIAKLQKKKKRIEEAQSKPKRLLRSRQISTELHAKRFPNPLISPDNNDLIQYLPNEMRLALLSNSRINIDMINQINISAPSDSNQGLKNIRRAVKLFEQSIETMPLLNGEKIITSKSTIPEQKIEPEEMYSLYLADKIQELCNIGVTPPNNAMGRKNMEFDPLGIKEMDDFYQFGNDQIF